MHIYVYVQYMYVLNVSTCFSISFLCQCIREERDFDGAAP